MDSPIIKSGNWTTGARMRLVEILPIGSDTFPPVILGISRHCHDGDSHCASVTVKSDSSRSALAACSEVQPSVLRAS